MALHNEIGRIGEDIAANWLIRNGFTVIDRNYRKKYGEIDIVAREVNENTLFVEVKTVSYETKEALQQVVSCGTWRPEENVHAEKQKRLARAIQAWISEKRYEGTWQIDVLAIRLVPSVKHASIKRISNVIFE